MSSQFSYFLNWMGPINANWIREHGDDWCAGRIDVRGGIEDEYPFGLEIAVPAMRAKSWAAFGQWLYGVRTNEVADLQDLVRMFEREMRTEIEWFGERNG